MRIALRLVGLPILALGSTASFARAQDAPSFRADVLPILESRCFECHQAPRTDSRGRLRKPKGGLRMDGIAWLRLGGDGGEVLVPGKPDASPLWSRTALPDDDPDLMPERGERLQKAQSDVLRAWNAAGASFGAWTGATSEQPAPTPAVPPDPAGTADSPAGSRVAQWTALAQGVPSVAASEFSKLTAMGALVEDLAGERRLLSIAFPGHRAAIDDDAVRTLDALRAHVVELDLAVTAISDRALMVVARMPRLWRLDLTGTSITGAGLRALAPAVELRTLVLVGTQLDGTALEQLPALPKLASVHLWRSQCTDDELAKLRLARPGLRVVGAPLLPPPETPEEGARPRRRR